MKQKSESQKSVTDKLVIARALQEIGALLELKGGEYFKARAYKLGARAIAEVTEDIGKLIKENRLTFVRGIGYALARQIQDLYTTGQSTFLNQLRAELPPGIIELGNLPGLSVKKVGRLHEELGISTVEELRAACESGQGILEHLRTAPALVQVELAGSLRRWQETVSEIVIVANSKKPKELINHF